MIILIIILILLSPITCQSKRWTFSVFHCGSYNAKSWEITNHTDHENSDIKNFQSFLYFWQNNCLNRKRSHEYIDNENDKNFATMIMNHIKHFILAIELGQIYRPKNNIKIIGYNNIHNCSLGLGAIDCFFKPISRCEAKKHHVYDIQAVDELDTMDLSTGKEIALTLGGHDICAAAKYMKKSVQWIHGQYLDFMIQSRLDIASNITRRKNEILDIVKQKESGMSIGVYVEGIHQISEVSALIEFIDMKSKFLIDNGKLLTMVYISSDSSIELNLLNNIVTAYPRPWSYSLSTSSRSGKDSVIDFLSDVEILSNTDMFIGFFSNMYIMIALLRIARNFGEHKDICYIDPFSVDLKDIILCEGSEAAKVSWRRFDGLGGYENPSSF